MEKNNTQSSISQKQLLASYLNDIKQMKSLSVAIHSKGVVVGKNGTVDVLMTPSQLSSLIATKRDIFQMEKEALELKTEIDNENNSDDNSNIFDIDSDWL